MGKKNKKGLREGIHTLLFSNGLVLNITSLGKKSKKEKAFFKEAQILS
jgi:hypothetical protein